MTPGLPNHAQPNSLFMCRDRMTKISDMQVPELCLPTNYREGTGNCAPAL